MKNGRISLLLVGTSRTIVLYCTCIVHHMSSPAISTIVFPTHPQARHVMNSLLAVQSSPFPCLIPLETETIFITFLPFLNLTRPTLNPLTLTPDRNIEFQVLHPDRSLHKFVIAHAARVGALLGEKLQHGCQKPGDLVRLLHLEMILLLQHVG